MKAPKYAAFVLLLILSFVAGARYEKRKLNNGNPGNKAIETESAGITVRTEKPIRRDVFETIKATGNLEAVDRVDVFAQLPGVVKECLIEEGQSVIKDDVLARLDDRELQLNYRQARSALSQASVNLKNLGETLKRNEELYRDKLISDQQIEQIRTQHAVAAGQVRQARVARDLAKLNLSYATVKAPMDGEVAARNCEKNQRITTADTIFEIAKLGTLRIRIFITEDEVHRVEKENRPVKIRFDALASTPNDREYIGKVVFISPIVNPDNGTVEVRVEVPNPDGVLKEGMFARLVVETEMHSNALVIPKQALAGEEGHYQVFLAEQGPEDKQPRAHKVDVRVGIMGPQYVEILEGSLDENASVIVDGQNMLSDGDTVVFASPMETGKNP